MSGNKQDDQLSFLDKGGRIGRRIRKLDWSRHPLGPVETWDAALRTSLGIVLSSSFPTFLAWGEDLTLFFNDPFEPMLGLKAHSLGSPYQAVWHELWDTLGPTIRRVLAGESFFFEDYEATLERNGYPEQAWFTFSYSPLRDERGAVRGVICTCIDVTDKMQAPARRKEAQERLALSLEASGDIGTWSYDLEDGTAYADERCARLFQVDPALARSGTGLQRFTDMIHPADRPRVLAAIEAAILHDTAYDIDYRIPQRCAADAWVNARGKVLADPATGRRRLAGSALDISARKLAEAAPGASEAPAAAASLRPEDSGRRLDALLDTAPVGIAYADTNGRLLVTNAANRAIWGDYLPENGIAGYDAWQGWQSDKGPDAGAPLAPQDWPIARVLAGGGEHEALIEIEPFGAPGVRRTVLVRARAMRDAGGKLVGAVAATMDLTVQVLAERALKESEQKFRSIVNLIPQMVWSSNVEGTDHYVNGRWHDYTGIRDIELAYNGWRKVVHPDDLAPMLAAWKACFAANALFEYAHRMAHYAGGYRWVLNRALPAFDGKGRATHWIGTLTDIHDQQAGADPLRGGRQDEFLARLAHELRNPLAPISNAAQLLAMTGANEQRIRQSSAVIIRQARRMAELADDLLDVTRGLVALERELVDIHAVVAGAVEQARPLIKARAHRLEFDLGGAGVRIIGDRARLVQVLAKLLHNAARYTPQGGRIVLSVSASAGTVAVSVRDNGIGIGADMLPQVFAPFSPFSPAGRTAGRSRGGLGLGLALVKSLVQLQGGRVEARSEGLGRGSTFSLVFDIASAGFGLAPKRP